MNVTEKISEIGVVPVIKLNNPEKDAEGLAKALTAGGVPVAEVTFRAAGAAKAIKLMSDACPDMLVGAGTVMCEAQVDEAIEAGAKFIVSPGLNPKVVAYCVSKNIPIVPGRANPSDIEAAIELGLSVVKFFPADVYGGIKAIKALSAPFGQVKFLPTGGVSEANLNEFAAKKSVIAVGGSWVCKKDDIINHDWEKITMLSENAVKIIKENRT